MQSVPELAWNRKHFGPAAVLRLLWGQPCLLFMFVHQNVAMKPGWHWLHDHTHTHSQPWLVSDFCKGPIMWTCFPMGAAPSDWRLNPWVKSMLSMHSTTEQCPYPLLYHWLPETPTFSFLLFMLKYSGKDNISFLLLISFFIRECQGCRITWNQEI